MQKITPFLWFDNNAEEAVNFYTDVFNNAKSKSSTTYSGESAKASGRPEGSVMTVAFEIDGFNFTAINGGPAFKINPSISFFYHTKDENEIVDLWEKLSDGGKIMMELNSYDWSKKYGWVEDKFGVSWQLMHVEKDLVQKIVPSLLFTKKTFGKANEAINYYSSVFRNSKVDSVFRYGAEVLPDNPDALMYSDFTLEGGKFSAMDGAGEHKFQFNEAVSLVVSCTGQDELDYYWHALSADPQAEMCGWLKDKYGVSWQIIPSNLGELLGSKEEGKAKRVTQQLLQMKKLDIKMLENA